MNLLQGNRYGNINKNEDAMGNLLEHHHNLLLPSLPLLLKNHLSNVDQRTQGFKPYLMKSSMEMIQKDMYRRHK